MRKALGNLIQSMGLRVAQAAHRGRPGDPFIYNPN